MAGLISYESPEPNEALASSDGKIRTALVKLKEALNGGLNNENLSGTAGITRANLAAESKPVTWYTPKVIAAEESRTNTAFGTLTTADEIKEVVVPTEGLVVIGYTASIKSSVAAAGSAAIFIGSNQLKADLGGSGYSLQETPTLGTVFHHLASHQGGLLIGGAEGTNWNGGTNTGLVIGTSLAGEGTISRFGMCTLSVIAGTYAISVQFKSTSGSVTVKERKLWIYTLGY